MDAGIERGLRSGLLDLLVNVLLRLMEHLLDACRMNTAIADEVLHGHACDFTANRVMGGNRNAFGRVVDDKVGARNLLKGADVASFSADDAALQIIGGDMDSGNGDLGGMVGSQALDGNAQNLTSLLVGLSARTRLRIADDGSRFVDALLFQAIEQLGFRLFGGKARNLLKSGCDFSLCAFDVLYTTVDLALQGRDLMLAMIKRLRALIETLLTLVKMVFRGANCLHALFAFALSILLHLKNFVFSLY